MGGASVECRFRRLQNVRRSREIWIAASKGDDVGPPGGKLQHLGAESDFLSRHSRRQCSTQRGGRAALGGDAVHACSFSLARAVSTCSKTSTNWAFRESGS